ncbi:hypothetical protein GCM10023147_37630 [Tsukamurella soli]|uniref:Uncharacterized protein n=1 Tax=Tsukamurella soli TaxID=644556 RepID=A0ABP8K344_9ACTN
MGRETGRPKVREDVGTREGTGGIEVRATRATVAPSPRKSSDMPRRRSRSLPRIRPLIGAGTGEREDADRGIVGDTVVARRSDSPAERDLAYETSSTTTEFVASVRYLHGRRRKVR